MIWLILGVATWSVLHLLKSAAPGFRGALIAKLGENGYRGLFSLLLLGALVLIVLGWRAAEPVEVYKPFDAIRPLGSLFILAGFWLMAASRSKSNVRRFVRHPQLSGVIAWAVGHLISNGDMLALILFGGMGAWAVLEMLLINRRDGAWAKPEPAPLSAEILPLGIGFALFVAIFFLHPYLFGVSPIPKE